MRKRADAASEKLLIARKGKRETNGIELCGQETDFIGGTSGIGKAVASLVLSNGGSALLVGRREAKTRERPGIGFMWRGFRMECGHNEAMPDAPL